MEQSDTFIHPTSIIDSGATIGKGTKVWHFCHVMASASIGSNCILGQNVYIDAQVKIGNGVKIQNNVSVYKGVEIEDDVFLGPSMVFTNVINPRSFIERKNEMRPTIVKKGASIGANASILCGLEIGEYAMIGAGAVVTKIVPAYAVMLGNPAQQSGWVSRAGIMLHFDAGNMAICSQSGEKYQRFENRIFLEK